TLVRQRDDLNTQADRLQDEVDQLRAAYLQNAQLTPQSAKALEAVLTEAELTIFRTELEILERQESRKALEKSTDALDRSPLGAKTALELRDVQAALDGAKLKQDAAMKRRDQIAASLKKSEAVLRDGAIQNRTVQLETLRELSRQLTR